MASRKPHAFNWALAVSIAVPMLTFVGTMAGFYWTTTATLTKHDEGLKKLGEDFKSFGEISKQNFAEWLKLNKEEHDKAEKIAKEERDLRDKMREQFTQLFTQLSTSGVQVKTQVESITKVLDTLQVKIDGISSVQQENRVIRQQSTGKGR